MNLGKFAFAICNQFGFLTSDLLVTVFYVAEGEKFIPGEVLKRVGTKVVKVLVKVETKREVTKFSFLLIL